RMLARRRLADWFRSSAARHRAEALPDRAGDVLGDRGQACGHAAADPASLEELAPIDSEVLLLIYGRGLTYRQAAPGRGGPPGARGGPARPRVTGAIAARRRAAGEADPV